MPQIIISGSTDVLDSFMDKGTPTNTNGSATVLQIGNSFGASFIYRGLFKFDLSNIPSGSKIISAVMELTVTSVNADNNSTLEVYRSRRAWEEASASWNNWKTGNAWSTAGAGDTTNDREATAIGSESITGGTLSAGSKVQISLDTDLMEEMLDGGSFTNNGFVVKTQAETGLDGYAFASVENATSSYRPTLTIEYGALDTTVWTSSYGIESDPTKVSGSSNLTDFPALISDSNLSSDVYAGLNPSIGYSIDLEASSSQYAYVADNVALSITGDITCEAWIKMEQLPSSFGDYFAITNKWDDLTGNNRSYLFSINTSNKLEFISSSNGLNQSGTNWNMGNNTVAFTSADVGKWIHVAVAVDTSASTMTFYKNGQAQTTTYVYQQASSIYDGSSAFIIGAKGAGGGTTSDYFDGKLSNVRIWSDVRTATEILENRHKTITGTADNLVGSWYNQDNDSNDNAGTNNLTTSGSPTIGTDTPLGGSDLRITTDSAGTTEVPFEIVSLDTVSETCEIWAKVPTLSYNSATSLYIWYGNSSALPYSASDTYGSQNVWTSDHRGVWHLEESSGTRLDSTSNANNLTDNNTVLSATGQIGTGADFEATNSEYLSKTDNASLSITDDLTISLWFKPESRGVDRAFISKWSGTQLSYAFIINEVSGSDHLELQWASSGSGVGFTRIRSNSEVIEAGDVGNFIHIFLSLDISANTAILLKNGVSQTFTDLSGSATSIFDGTADLNLGASNSSQYLDGVEDEVRLISGTKTSDWGITEYNNQNSPSTFWTAVSGVTFTPRVMIF